MLTALKHQKRFSFIYSGNQNYETSSRTVNQTEFQKETISTYRYFNSVGQLIPLPQVRFHRRLSISYLESSFLTAQVRQNERRPLVKGNEDAWYKGETALCATAPQPEKVSKMRTRAKSST